MPSADRTNLTKYFLEEYKEEIIQKGKQNTVKNKKVDVFASNELDNFCNNFCYSLWLLACFLVLDSHILVNVLFLTSRKCFIIMAPFRIHDG
jgi:hypothetical protein